MNAVIPEPPTIKEREPIYKELTRYDLATGKLLSAGRYQYSQALDESYGYVDGMHDLNTKYYDLDTNDIADSLPLEAQLSADVIQLGETITLSQLPMPCSVSVDSMPAPIIVDDGYLVITPSSIGDAYRVTVDAVGHIRQSYFFEVIEQ